MSGMPLRSQGRNSSGPRLNRLVNPEPPVSRGHAVGTTPGHQAPPRGWETFKWMGNLQPELWRTFARRGRTHSLRDADGLPARPAAPSAPANRPSAGPSPVRRSHDMVRLHVVGTTRRAPPEAPRPPGPCYESERRSGRPPRSLAIEPGVRSRCIFAGRSGRTSALARPASVAAVRPALRLFFRIGNLPGAVTKLVPESSPMPLSRSKHSGCRFHRFSRPRTPSVTSAPGRRRSPVPGRPKPQGRTPLILTLLPGRRSRPSRRDRAATTSARLEAVATVLPAPPPGRLRGIVLRPGGTWRDVGAVESATLAWVHWFNHHRLLGALGDVPPAEFEAMYDQTHEAPEKEVCVM